MNWILQDGSELKEAPEGFYGFIYILVYENKKGNLYYYVGKKQFFKTLTKDMLKNGNKRNGHVKFKPRLKKEIVKIEDNWRDYQGSSSSVSINDLKLIKKTILKLCRTKIEHTYYEEYFLFGLNAIINPQYLNDSIAKRYFRGKIQ